MAPTGTLLLRYIIYGALTCAVVIVPWMAIEAVLTRLPGGRDVQRFLQGFGLPDPIEALVLVFVVTAALGFVGWLSRRFLWPRLENIPLFRNFIPSVDRLAAEVGTGEGRRADHVVWVAWPSAQIRTLGIVTGRVRAPATGCARLVVVLLPNAGQPKSAMLRFVDPDQVEQTGWTLDQAISFVTSSGTMGRGDGTASTEAGTEFSNPA